MERIFPEKAALKIERRILCRRGCFFIVKLHLTIITGSVRTNGGGCEKTGDPNTRYLGTEYGQELKLAPGGVYITAGKSNLVANFDDEEGVKISSHKKLILEAEQEIIIESQKTVSISAASQILIATPSAAISMENETHFLAAQTHITCTDEAPFPDVEQPEQEQEEEEQVNPARAAEESQQDSGIDMSSIVASAKGAIAVIGDFLGGVGAAIVGDSDCSNRSDAYKTGFEMTSSLLRSTVALATGVLGAVVMFSELKMVSKSSGGDNPALEMATAAVVTVVAGALILRKSGELFDFTRLFASQSGGASDGPSKDGKMLGENGTKLNSKTVWQNGKTERIDVENPAPGERDGQIHYHEPNNKKWYYDTENKKFYDQKTGEDAPKKIQKLLKDDEIKKSIKKSLEILGED